MSIVTEKNAQTPRNGQYPLLVADRCNHFLSQLHAKQQRPFLIAGRATTAPPARKHHEKLYHNPDNAPVRIPSANPYI